MSLFSFSRPKRELVAIFDVGSASVGGALVLLVAGEHPTLLYSARMEMKISQSQSAERMLFVLKNSFEAVARLLEREGMRRVRAEYTITELPSRAACFFSSPWHASAIRKLSLSGDNPFVITENMVAKIIEKEVDLLSLERRSEYGAHGFSSAEGAPHVVESHIVASLLNGYPVGNIVGKQAKTVTMSLFTSFLPEAVIATVERVIHTTLNLKNIAHHSFTIPYFSVTRDIWGAHESFFLADVGGETTDLSLVREHTLVGTTSFPFGKNTLIRRCAKLRNISFVESASLLNLFLSQKGDAKTVKSMERDLAIFREEWAQLFLQAVSFIAEKESVPRVVFLLADDPYGRIFVAAAKSAALPPPLAGFAVHHLRQGAFSTLVPIKPAAAGSAFFSIEALFMQKQFEQSRAHPFFLYRALPYAVQ